MQPDQGCDMFKARSALYGLLSQDKGFVVAAQGLENCGPLTVDIIGHDHLRAGEPKPAIEVFKLNLLAYPDSADAHANPEAYLEDGQKDLVRQYAEKALAMLDSHAAPASSWSDTE